MKDKIGWKTKYILSKFRDPTGEVERFLTTGGSLDEARQRFEYLGTEVHEGNVALNEGLQLLVEIITGIDTTSNKWDNTNANIGVGDGTTAADASQTGLQGTNTAFAGMDSGYPQRSSQTASWRATFGSAEANFAWEEATVVNASDDTGTNLNRIVSSKGTKASGETWTAEIQITFS